MSEDSKPWIFNSEKALEGVFCPVCGKWVDDYYGVPDNCPKCNQRLSGWIDANDELPPRFYP